MRLRTLLLGSSAALLVGGATTTAQAADPAGLVVTTMANYVESCNNGNGWKKKDWCITLAGNVEFTTAIGAKLTYGDDPWDTEVDALGDGGIFWSQEIGITPFEVDADLTLTATRMTDHGNLTLTMDIFDQTTATISVGPWRFNKDGVRYQNTFGGATISLFVQDPNTLGWKDPRGGNFDVAGPWPDLAMDVALSMGPADLTFGINGGQRSNDVDFTDFYTLGGYVQAAMDVGPAGLLLRADFDRVNAADDGTGAPVWAYGLRGEVTVGLGDRAEVVVGAVWSHNYGYGGPSGTGYNYAEHELGNYYSIYGTLNFELSDLLEIDFNANLTAGPDRPEDRVLEVGTTLTFTPSSASPLYIKVKGSYAHQLGVMNTARAINVGLTVGAAF
jgi:hypothetical protein